MNKEVFKGMTREQKAEILQKTAETGKPIDQIIVDVLAKWKIVLLDQDGCFTHEGKQITPDEWQKLDPVNEYTHLVILHTPNTKRNEH